MKTGKLEEGRASRVVFVVFKGGGERRFRVLKFENGLEEEATRGNGGEGRARR